MEFHHQLFGSTEKWKTPRQGHIAVHVYKKAADNAPGRWSYKSLGSIQRARLDVWLQCLVALKCLESGIIFQHYSGSWDLFSSTWKNCKVWSGQNHFYSVPGLPAGYFMVALCIERTSECVSIKFASLRAPRWRREAGTVSAAENGGTVQSTDFRVYWAWAWSPRCTWTEWVTLTAVSCLQNTWKCSPQEWYSFA